MISLADRQTHYRQRQPESWLQPGSETIAVKYQDMLRNYLVHSGIDQIDPERSSQKHECLTQDHEQFLHQVLAPHRYYGSVRQ
jgi:hypothetical protein